jgi:hypothetical protein
MFFNHKAAAVEGVGFGHKVLAVLGLRWFDVSIEVKPAGGSPWFPVEDYYIVIKVKTKSGKVYTASYLTTAHGLRHIIKVTAVFKGIKIYLDAVKVAVSNVKLKIQKVIASAFVKTKQ